MTGVFCSVRETINIIGTRPRLLIIQHLGADEMSFNALKRVTGLSSRTLSLNLQFLIEKKLVVKQDSGTYLLSKQAKSLLPLLQEMGEWGQQVGIWH